MFLFKRKKKGKSRATLATLLQKDVNEWSVEDVLCWLEANGLGEYKTLFKQNDINGSALIEFTPDDLATLNITKLGHRKKLLKLIKKLNNPESHYDTDDILSDMSDNTTSQTFDYSDMTSESLVRQMGVTEEEILFKCYFNEDVRVLKMKREFITYYALKGNIIEEFGDELGTDFTIKYYDCDNDLITIKKDKDLLISLTHASKGLLKLHLFKSNKEKIEEKKVVENTQPQYDDSMEIFETMVNGVIIIGADKLIKFFNKSAEQMFGYSKQEVLGKNIKILMPEPHSSKHDEYVDMYLHTGRKNVIGKGRMVQAKNKHGALFPIWLSIVETELEGQRAFTGTIQDLRKTKLETPKPKIQVIGMLESLVDAVVIMTDDCIVRYFNKAAEQMFNFERTEVIGKSVNLLMPDYFSKKHDEYVQNYLITKKSTIIGKGRKVTAKKKDGTIFKIWLNLAESSWENQHAFTATIQDLSSDEIFEKAISS